MTGVLVLLAGAAFAVFAAPLLLSRAGWAGWRARRPGAALALWCAAFLGGLAAAGASLVWALLLATGWQQPGEAAHQELLTVLVVAVVGWVGLAASGALASLVLSRAEPLTAEHRRTRALLAALSASSAYRRQQLGRFAVVFVDSDIPMAVSLPGRSARIVLTSRLEDELTGPQLRAVIEHERAHLLQRHGWITGLARLNAACLPGFFGAREFERAARLLVELIADDAAVRAGGPGSLAAALATLAALQDDEGLALRSRRIADAARSAPPVPAAAGARER